MKCWLQHRRSFREYKSSCRPKGVFCKSISTSYYLAQTMRFSFTAVVALTTSIMSVSMCSPREVPCSHDWDCCDQLDLCVSIVSSRSLLCNFFSLDDSPFGPRDISQMVPKCAIIKVISPKEAVKFTGSNTLVGCVPAFPLIYADKQNRRGAQSRAHTNTTLDQYTTSRLYLHCW
jgi:hypothetical protein